MIIEPQKVIIEPQKVIIKPQKVIIKLLKVIIELPKVIVELPKVNIELPKVNIEPQKLKIDFLFLTKNSKKKCYKHTERFLSELYLSKSDRLLLTASVSQKDNSAIALYHLN